MPAQKCWHKDSTRKTSFHIFPSSLVVVITTALVASYTITDFFLFAVALVFTDNPFVLATILFILAFVRPAAFIAPVFAIIIICKQ